MRAHIPKVFRQLTLKRAAALAIGPGILAVGIDAAIAHFAGREDVAVPAQYIPALFGPAACLALVAGALPPKLRATTFRRLLQLVGAVGVAVGTLGTAFHARAFLRLLEGTPLTFRGVEAALAVAPPLFAPGAFAGIGALLWLLANPRFTVKLEPLAPNPAAGPVLVRTTEPLRKAA